MKKNILLFLICLILPRSVLAADYSNVKINEVYPNANTGEDEWIEIYNPDNVELNNVNLLDEQEVRATISGNNNKYIILKLTDTFRNTGKKLILEIPESSESSRLEIDICTYPDFSSHKGESYARLPNGTGNFQITNNPTKGSSNQASDPTPTPTSTPTPTPEPEINNIYITEIFPNPETGENEWIELYNDNDDEVDISDWYIKDEAGNKKTLSDFTIVSKSYTYFAFTSGYLNNDSDKVILYNSDNEEKDSLTDLYPAIEKGKSWAKIDGSWCLAEPTKGNSNNSCYESNDEIEEEIEEDESEGEGEALLVKSNKIKDQDMDLPALTTKESDTREASVAGVSDERMPMVDAPSKNIPTIAYFIAGFGLLLMGGASMPFIWPKIQPFFAKIKKSKKTEKPSLTLE